VALLSAITTNT